MKSYRTFALAVLVLAACQGSALAVGASSVSIDDPAPGDKFGTSGSIGCDGTATPKGSTFVLKLFSSNGGAAVNSVGVTANADGSWSATIPSPSSPYAPGQYYIQAFYDGTAVSTAISIIIE